jgi:hypothetical protein
MSWERAQVMTGGCQTPRGLTLEKGPASFIFKYQDEGEAWRCLGHRMEGGSSLFSGV